MPPLQLTLEEQICAIVSDLAYAAHKDMSIEGRYSYDRVQTALNNHINEKRARGDEAGANALREYKVSDNHEHTNQNIVTLVNKKEKKVIVGYRGTMLSWRGIVYDIFLNNTLVAFNSFGGRRCLTALEHTQRVKNDFGHGYELVVTGHSLGGSNANFVSKILNVRGIGFNIGSAVLEDPEYKTLAGIVNNIMFLTSFNLCINCFSSTTMKTNLSTFVSRAMLYHQRIKGFRALMMAFLVCGPIALLIFLNMEGSTITTMLILH